MKRKPPERIPIITSKNKDNLLRDKTTYDGTEAHSFAERYIDHFFPEGKEILLSSFFDFYMMLRNAEEGVPHVSGTSFEDALESLYSDFQTNFPQETERIEKENPLYFEHVGTSSYRNSALSPSLSPFATITIGVLVYRGVENELERRKMPLILPPPLEPPDLSVYGRREISRIALRYIGGSDKRYEPEFLHNLFMRFFHAIESAGGLPEISDRYFAYAIAELFQTNKEKGGDIAEAMTNRLLEERTRIQAVNPTYVELVDSIARQYGPYHTSSYDAMMVLNIGMLLYRTMEAEVEDHGRTMSRGQKRI